MIPVLGLAAQLIMAGILLLAGVKKLIERNQSTLFLSALWPEFRPKANFLVIVISIVEVIIGLAVLIAPLLGASLAALLFGAFAIVLILARRAGIDLPCGCFGRMKVGDNRGELNRDLLWMLSALSIVASSSSVLPVNSSIPQAFLFLTSISFSLWGGLIGIREQVGQFDSPISRRTFLKLAAASTLGLAFYKFVNPTACCGCQYYDHWDPPCCGNPPSFHTHHYYKRCCNLCTGAKGNWHSYKANACKDCECVDPPCDVMYSCVSGGCYSSECCA